MDSQTGSRVTIDQVAKICGVSKTTISRFLNGKYENMSIQTRERIEAAIAELNYRPNRSAQRLKASKSMLIGCVIADVSSPFAAILLKGVTTVCEEADYQVLFADSAGSARRETRIIEGFLENRVDGLIINTCGGNDEYLLSLQRRGIPTVLADRELLESGLMDTVAVPNRQSACEATKYLFRQGYSAVGFFTEMICSITPRLLRRQGYFDAIMSLEGEHSEPEIYEFGAEDIQGCACCIRAFIDKHPGERLAIFSSNGTTAQSLLLAIADMGLELGYELGMCTFDDWSLLRIAKPSISAVALGTVEIGAQAAKLLLERINGSRPDDSKPVTIMIPTMLKERRSSPGQK